MTNLTPAYVLFDFQCEEIERLYDLCVEKYGNDPRALSLHLTDCAWYLSRQPSFADPYGEGVDYSESVFIAINEYIDDLKSPCVRA